MDFPRRRECSISNCGVNCFQWGLRIARHGADTGKVGYISAGAVCPGSVDIDRRVTVSLTQSTALSWGRRLVRSHRLEVEKNWQVGEISRQPWPITVAICDKVVRPRQTVVGVEFTETPTREFITTPEAVDLGELAGLAAV
jgi:hypothetical protein